MDDRYSREAQRVYQPFAQQAESAMRGRLADQGLLSSTGGQGAVQQTGDEWRGRMIDYATQQGNTMRNFSEGQRQFNRNYGLQRDQFSEGQRQFNKNYGLQRDQFADSQSQFGVNAGMRAWELMQSGALGRRSLQGDNRGINYPQDPAFFRDLFRQRYTGDPAEQRPKGDPNFQWGRYEEPYKKDLSKITEERVASDNAAQRALQERLAAEQMAYQRDRMAQEQSQFDQSFDAQHGTPDESQMWSIMAGEAGQNRIAGQEMPGSNLLPTQLINKWKSEFGIDIEEEVRKGNPQAIGLIYTMYGPETAKQVIERLQQTPLSRPMPQQHAMMGGGAPEQSGFAPQPFAPRELSGGPGRQIGQSIANQVGGDANVLKNAWNWLFHR